MNICAVTPLILTFDEAPNILRTLEKLVWAQEIIIVDSFSRDRTLEIVQRFPNVRVIQRPFDSFADQCNFGIDQVKTAWVLSLDADYVLSGELLAEIQELSASGDTAGFSARFQYWICGRPLRGSLYPPRTVLYRKDKARYENDGHGHRVQINGAISPLRGLIFHDDRKPLGRWLWAQDKYARLEVEKLLKASHGSLRLQDRLRLWIFPAPFIVLFYTLIIKRALFDGWPGWLYAWQRTTAELILSMHLIEARLRGREVVNDQASDASPFP
jgi:glycosyltransferase involved in cell wall biosynthesis